MYRFIFLFCLSFAAQGITLENHSWKLNDISKQQLTLEKMKQSLKTNWDHQASNEDLAHLYSYQLHKKFNINTAKIFLFTGNPSAQLATLVNDSNQFIAFDHQDKSFLHLPDWILKKAQSYCQEIKKPNEQIIFLMQIKRFKPANDQCYYLIVPGHIYQQTEIYPTSTPKDYLEGDVVDACYQATDRRLFKKDGKRCRSWVRKI